MKREPLSFIIAHKNLALLFFVLYFLHVNLWFCSYSWCHGFEIFLFPHAVIVWVVLMVLARIATLFYGNLIKRISCDKTKRIINAIIIGLVLFVFYCSLTITNNSRSYLYYKSAVALNNPRFCEETFFFSCIADIAKKTSDASYCNYKGNYYNDRDKGFYISYNRNLIRAHYEDCISGIR